MRDIAAMRRLLTEYGQLERLVGTTSQLRGQRFDHVIAEMLQGWGVSANAAQRSRGEIDVQFSLAPNQRHVLEAKWWAPKVDTGPLAKLQKRVQQRLNGVFGVFLSMSGYTADGLADLKDGQRLEMLLLDRSHFEAMLSGFASPAELFAAVHDQAAFHGDPYTPVGKLLASRSGKPTVQFGTGIASAIAVPFGGATAEALLTVRGTRSLCVAGGVGGSLLLATDGGVFEADPDALAVTRRVAIEGPFTGVFGDGAGIVVARGAGVASVGAGGPVVIGGGLGDVVRLRRAGGGVQALTGDDDGGYRLLDLGASLADQVEHVAGVEEGVFADLCWDGGDGVLGIRDGRLWSSVTGAIDGFGDALERVRWLGGGRVPVVGRNAQDERFVAVGDLGTGEFAEVLRLGREVVFLGFADGDRLVLTVRDDSGARPVFTVIEVEVPEALGAGTEDVVEVVSPPMPPPPVPPSPVTVAVPEPAFAGPPEAALAASARPWASPSGEAMAPPTPASTGAPAPPTWNFERSERANHGSFAVFGENRSLAIAMVVLAIVLTPVLLLTALLGDRSPWLRIGLGMVAVLAALAGWGAGMTARSPIHVEIGAQGIQLFGRKRVAWFPWEAVDAVGVQNVGGASHMTVACLGAAAFPRTDNRNSGPRYIPELDRVAVVSLATLKGTRQEVTHALRTFAPGKYNPAA